MYYFAYDSNLSHTQMLDRCPEAKFISRAYINNYKLIFDGISMRWGGAVANVIQSDDSVVVGALYKLTELDFELLNGFEGYPIRYKRKSMRVWVIKEESLNAFIYYREQLEIGKQLKSI